MNGLKLFLGLWGGTLSLQSYLYGVWAMGQVYPLNEPWVFVALPVYAGVFVWGFLTLHRLDWLKE